MPPLLLPDNGCGRVEPFFHDVNHFTSTASALYSDACGGSTLEKAASKLGPEREGVF